MNYIPILSALIPALVLLGYIYWRDRKSPEPIWQLVKATALGVASIGVSLCISRPLQAIGLIPEDIYSIGDAINVAFLGAAIPEELAKFVLLWLFLRNNGVAIARQLLRKNFPVSPCKKVYFPQAEEVFIK